MRKGSFSVFIFSFFVLNGFLFSSEGVRERLSARTDVKKFIAMMVKKHAFDHGYLQTLFDQVVLRKDAPVVIVPLLQPHITGRSRKVLLAKKPSEGKPWYTYRLQFLNKARINGGVTFWQNHAAILERAEKEYGVPAEIILAIIGIETYYGKITGKFRAIDSLSTLAFNKGRRSDYFRDELENYLLMTREENLHPLGVLSSWDGGLGYPQFMPSSYRRHAIDYSVTGTRDLWNDMHDVIGSVANYLKKFGWQVQKPIAQSISLKKTVNGKYLANDSKNRTWETKNTGSFLTKAGITVPKPFKDVKVALISLATDATKKEYWLCFDNFFVITKYNKSFFYAMAVFQLSQEIKKAYQESLIKT